MFPERDALDIAKRECKGDATPDEVDWLHAEENRLAWCHALITALSDSDSQMLFHKTRMDMLSKDMNLDLVDINDYQEEKLKFDEWLRKAQRYRSGISQRLSEVKTILGDSSNIDFVEENARLTRAIIEHKRGAFEGGYSVETHDIRLWSTVAQPQ